MRKPAALTDQYLNQKEAAEYLRVKESTLYKWVHQRRIRFRKHGGRNIFLVDDLNEWSERQIVEPLAEI